MTRRRAAPSLAARKMLKLTVTAETSATPEQVLAGAGTDFSAHRAKVWPNVTVKRLEVHELGDSYAEVTEGATAGGLGFGWMLRSALKEVERAPARSTGPDPAKAAA